MHKGHAQINIFLCVLFWGVLYAISIYWRKLNGVNAGVRSVCHRHWRTARDGRVNCVIGAGRVAPVQCLFVFACELLSATSACSPDDMNYSRKTSPVGQRRNRLASTKSISDVAYIIIYNFAVRQKVIWQGAIYRVSLSLSVCALICVSLFGAHACDVQWSVAVAAGWIMGLIWWTELVGQAEHPWTYLSVRMIRGWIYRCIDWILETVSYFIESILTFIKFVHKIKTQIEFNCNINIEDNYKWHFKLNLLSIT